MQLCVAIFSEKLPQSEEQPGCDGENHYTRPQSFATDTMMHLSAQPDANEDGGKKIQGINQVTGC